MKKHGRIFGTFYVATPTVLWVSALAVLLFGSCQKQPQLQKIGGFAQGSYYAVSYFTAEPALSGERLRPAVDSILDAFDLCASLWNDSSEICRVNRGEDIPLSPMFCDMFEKSQSISRLTQGAFDITVSPLVKRYGFAKSAEGGGGRTLSDAELSEILSYVGYEKVRIENGRLHKDDPRLQLDFNAVAQGYAAEIVASYLEEYGIKSYLVDVGGEITSKGGKPDGSPWIVGIEKPAADAMAERMVMQKMKLQNQSLVTSGSYRKYFEEGGERYSHTINPADGRPVRHNLLSATVLCPACWEADALATACMVMGLDSARAFFARYPGQYEGFLIYTEPVPCAENPDSTRLATWHTPGFPLIP